MPVCSVCQIEMDDLETFGPLNQPLCREHWWAYLRRLEDPDEETAHPTGREFPNDPPQTPGQTSLL